MWNFRQAFTISVIYLSLILLTNGQLDDGSSSTHSEDMNPDVMKLKPWNIVKGAWFLGTTIIKFPSKSKCSLNSDCKLLFLYLLFLSNKI